MLHASKVARLKCMTYKTSLKISKKKKPSKQKVAKAFRRKLKLDSLQRILLIFFVLLTSTLIFASIYALNYLQNISQDLPSPDKPFGDKDTATEIYDRNGKLLYRVFDDEDRDPVDLDEVPPLLMWTYLAAEDIRFFKHEGIDPEAILRCGLRYLEEREISCGGSTITQQLIRKTTLTDDVNMTRKLREMLLSMKIEQIRTKEEIMEMYLTIVPSGSNIYGVTRASKFYFGKDPSELTLAEMAVLASIPQNPSVLSPTKSTNPAVSAEMLEARKQYVLDQLSLNMDYINSQIQNKTDTELTEDMIEEARGEKLAYQDPAFTISAPHFVFYTLDQLQKNPYNNGEVFTLESIETDGLRIHTTLDLELQRIAEAQVQSAVEIYGRQFGADNAAMVAMNPKTGEILSMVGSYNYFGKESPEGCVVGLNCRLEPKVNVVDTLQAYGSTMKPMIYYHSFMNGLITPEGILDDSPVRIGNYTPKNYDNKFSGIHTSRYMLVQSRNIPAIVLLDQFGVPNFINSLKEWGYTTMDNPAGYGVSLAVGGGEVKLIEHAQAFSVFANNGKLAKTEVIDKITDRQGNVLYQREVETKQVADPRGVYLVNDILNGNRNGPGYSFDGRDLAGKTGTSESQKETLYVAYSPEVVVAGILLNNDNTPMRYGATGLTSVRPWVGEFLTLTGDRFPPTPFDFPSGLEIRANGDLFIRGISSDRQNISRNNPVYQRRRNSFN